MTRRELGLYIVFSPITIGLILCMAVLIVAELPKFCCERWKAVRHLPLAGLAYYGLLVPCGIFALGSLAWWEIILSTILFGFCGNCLLPDPITYFWSPRKRRAVRVAIEHLESKDGPGVNYPGVKVIGSENGRTIVSLEIMSGRKPPECKFLAVGDDGVTVDELDFQYVAANHSVQSYLL